MKSGLKKMIIIIAAAVMLMTVFAASCKNDGTGSGASSEESSESSIKKDSRTSTIKEKSVTKIYLGYVYQKIDPIGESIYLETSLGEPYFDRVRKGDSLTFKIEVTKSGTYDWCMITGWDKGVVNGVFTLLVDGKEKSKLINQEEGIYWRTWKDSNAEKVELEEGIHEVTIVFGSDGPNIYGIKFAPEGKEITKETQKYEEITDSQKDLTEYALPETSRYLTATVQPDTWVFTDGLGRVSLTNAEVGDVRQDKTVAMFFWIWHATFANTRSGFNVQGYIDQQTAAGIPLEDYLYDYDYEGWLAKDFTVQYFWDEPIYGFYRSDDEWVIRKQAELLSAAGIDVVFTDNSNGTATWIDAYPVLYETWTKAMQDGVDTPKISNLMPFSSGDNTKIQLLELYSGIYLAEKYRPLWFYWDGKPMIMAYGYQSLGYSALETQIANFFEFRFPQPDYFIKDSGLYYWGWLSTFKQALYYKSEEERQKGIVEQMSVGIAQNANYVNQELASMSGHNIMGRSYTTDYENRYDELGDEASKWGYNFAQQFEYALEVDPKLIFVTGWNEWCASRYEKWPDWRGNNSGVENGFPDEFNDEFSRDIEPTRGALADHYYYQLVNFVRRYKGALAIPTPSGEKTIDMKSGYEQWQNVEPYYAANIGNIGDRDAKGYGDLVYTEYSGRNDIIGAQVSRDGENLWFLVECASDITPFTDKLWMNLYIDCDQQNGGWNTFDYVVNKTAPSETLAVLERFVDGYASEKIADVEYKIDGRYMTVKIPKSAIGIEGEEYTVNFAWTDNVHDVNDKGTGEGKDTVYSEFSGDILDFYTSGDVAPGGRFKFSYIVK
ncbi:MAG: hypothetical protein J5850_04700 [Clostridia bacterium]|nr:hypothetical protein [Clostridia bacterium]